MQDAFEGDRELRKLLELSERRTMNANGGVFTKSPLNSRSRRRHSVSANNNKPLDGHDDVIVNDGTVSVVLESENGTAVSVQSGGMVASNCAYRHSQQHLPPHLPHPLHPPPGASHAAAGGRDSTATATAGEDKFQKHFLRLMNKVHETVERNEVRLKRLDEREMLKLEWNLVALIIDRLLLWIFIIVTLAVTFGIVFQSPHAYDFIFRTRSSSSTSLHSSDNESL